MMNSYNEWKSFFSDAIRHVFICGCGHSGTSLCLLILSQHSEIFGIKEETGLFMTDRSHLLYKVSEKNAVKYKKGILLEKTPGHVMHLKTITELVPRSQVIILVRNPLDVIGSLKKRGIDFVECCHEYVQSNEEALQYKNHNHVITVKYEELVEEPQKEIARICDFLEIEYEEGMLDYYKSPGNYFGAEELKETDGFGTANHVLLRNWQMHQPVTNKSGEWRKRLMLNEYYFIKKKIFPLAQRLGYTCNEEYMLQK